VSVYSMSSVCKMTVMCDMHPHCVFPVASGTCYSDDRTSRSPAWTCLPAHTAFAHAQLTHLQIEVCLQMAA
jgi:hypothetical protein